MYIILSPSGIADASVQHLSAWKAGYLETDDGSFPVQDVVPDPRQSCGPYKPESAAR